MRKIMLLLFVLGALASSTSFGQGKNRISLQTGLFHCFFDGTTVSDAESNEGEKTINNLCGGRLNDTRGIQYQRLLYNKFALSIEYTKFSDGFIPIDFTEKFNSNAIPVLIGKNSKTITFNF